METGKKTSPASLLNELESKDLLRQWDIAAVPDRAVRTADEARAAGNELGYPVALKVCSDHIPHKSESGGVALDLASEDVLARAFEEMEPRFGGVPHFFLVQPMAAKGLELILGMRRDPVFGPAVMAGFGGVFAEVLKDTAIELAPVRVSTARSMLSRLRGADLFHGYRGRSPVNLDAVAGAIASLSKLALSRRDIVEIDINPLIVNQDGAVAADALVRLDNSSKRHKGKRKHHGSMRPFFSPRSIALVGASRSHNKGGNIILRNLIKAGYRGTIYPINPSGQDILGMKSYPSILDTPEIPELAMIIIPKEGVPDALDRCGRKGIRAVILATGGYSDIGEEGRREQEILTAAARTLGIRLMGPNSIGTVNPQNGLATSIVGLEPIPAGGVSLFGQSGVFSSGWGRWIGDFKPFGIAKIACIGNKGDVDETDLLEFLADDPGTSTIGMYLEGVSDGAAFLAAAAKAGGKKPVVVLKSGRSDAGAAAIASHTGSLAGADAIFDAVCRRTGMIRALDSEEFFDSLAAFESQPLPRSNRMGVLSITGMGCVIAADSAGELGVELPGLKAATIKRLRELIPAWAPVRNPVDIWSAVEQHGSAKTMTHISGCLLDQRDIDALLIVFVLMPESVFDIGEAFGDLIRRHPNKPVMAAHFGGTEREIRHLHHGFRSLGVPVYPSPERAVRAFASMVRYALRPR